MSETLEAVFVSTSAFLMTTGSALASGFSITL